MVCPIIYITRGQISDSFEVKRREWFRRKHSTDLLGVGFWSARGYRCPTPPQNCNVYELPEAQILSSAAYMEARKADTFSPNVMKEFTYLSASIYTQVAVADDQGAPLDSVPTVRGPILAMLNFEADGEVVQPWFEREVVGRHRGIQGVRTIRLWEQRDAHPLFPPKEPRWCVAVEWAREPGADLARLHEVPFEGEFRVEKRRADVARKWFGLVREDIFEQGLDPSG